MDDRISVIVPVYNEEENLNRCLRSIVNQTYHNLEIILVNDGSTDNSRIICDEFALQDKRIKVIHKQNEGLVRARKSGLDIATGKYIGFVDSDDYIESQMFESLCIEIEKDGIDIVHSGFFSNGVAATFPENFVVGRDGDICEHLRDFVFDIDSYNHIMPSIWSKLFKSECIKKCYSMVPDDISYGEDLVCLIVTLCENYSIKSIGKAFYNYSIRECSMSHRASCSNYRKTIALQDTIRSILFEYQVLDRLHDTLNVFLNYNISHALKNNTKDLFAIQQYRIENIGILFGKRIVLYGAGEVGRSYYTQISRYKECEIVLWVDGNSENVNYDCCSVNSIDSIKNIRYDFVLIAVKNKKAADEIKNCLIMQNVIEDRIVWIAPKFNL